MTTTTVEDLTKGFGNLDVDDLLNDVLRNDEKLNIVQPGLSTFINFEQTKKNNWKTHIYKHSLEKKIKIQQNVEKDKEILYKDSPLTKDLKKGESDFERFSNLQQPNRLFKLYEFQTIVLLLEKTNPNEYPALNVRMSSKKISNTDYNKEFFGKEKKRSPIIYFAGKLSKMPFSSLFFVDGKAAKLIEDNWSQQKAYFPIFTKYQNYEEFQNYNILKYKIDYNFEVSRLAILRELQNKQTVLFPRQQIIQIINDLEQQSKQYLNPIDEKVFKFETPVKDRFIDGSITEKINDMVKLVQTQIEADNFIDQSYLLERLTDVKTYWKNVQGFPTISLEISEIKLKDREYSDEEIKEGLQSLERKKKTKAYFGYRNGQKKTQPYYKQNDVSIYDLYDGKGKQLTNENDLKQFFEDLAPVLANLALLRKIWYYSLSTEFKDSKNFILSRFPKNQKTNKIIEPDFSYYLLLDVYKDKKK